MLYHKTVLNFELSSALMFYSILAALHLYCLNVFSFLLLSISLVSERFNIL